jgi:hypothetical protein
MSERITIERSVPVTISWRIEPEGCCWVNELRPTVRLLVEGTWEIR